MATAWLIKQFIDRRLRFYFVAEGETVEGGIPFDMFGAEFTHQGEDCSFETMIKRFGLNGDRALSEMAEIVHDIDLKDDKFNRREANRMGETLRDNIATDEKQAGEAASDVDHEMPAWREVFLYFLMLGFINVGGPVAQITMMYNHMVERRRWLSDERFVKIMGFCHMLPGPEALQLAIYVGYLKRRLLGGRLRAVGRQRPGRARLR